MIDVLAVMSGQGAPSWLALLARHLRIVYSFGMRAVLQRVTRAAVRVDEKTVGEIGPGLVVLLGVARTDGADESRALAERVAMLRIFPDEAGKLNRSLVDTGGAVLVVSQFTLLADTRKGRRPSFIDAAPPAQAEPLVEEFVGELRAVGVPVATGQFRARMRVELVNDGPVTIILDSR